MKLIETSGLPIKSWCNDPEAGAIEQARHIAALPFAYHHIALMPDTHQGYGMPIGGVLATVDTIIPNAVGVDIGCGMLATQTSLRDISQEEVKRIMGLLRGRIPLGFKHRTTPLDIPPPPDNAPIAQAEYESARHQAGTLGGGNHFIEIQRGSDGYIWFMVHSGSRNIGKKVCDHYNALARRLNAKEKSPVPANWDLAYFSTETEEGRQYLAEMGYCQAFAAENRRVMAEEILGAFAEVRGIARADVGMRTVNVHHNYAQFERHFGRDVWVHRKGATSAQMGEAGIVPGSQGTKSYIVTGLGNPASFCSCSHGAGRRMGRKEAQRTLSLAEEKRRMDERGIVHGLRNERDLDEAAGAYKDIDVVMQEQSDLVTIAVELVPLGVIKA